MEPSGGEALKVLLLQKSVIKLRESVENPVEDLFVGGKVALHLHRENLGPESRSQVALEG
jgi:hypothetical protein